ncbi:hypothetical protein AWR36_012015 [Microbulbifer flavimaris]|uniref:Cytochrome b562 n=1 Tax=Microbulbifer flavimaris TaxID=1781068 RepID=A0ABX4HX76_9GAMM|nr:MULTISPECIES: DUF6746 family protein [Microbulbifer]KUJ82518.1 hypothetical protein AVO43_11980 [Microbulbifer sp. ZGT114]PCO04724.1 hypothetical protein AWR36_012015 [Microbulbifer flavimaris]
MNKLVLVLLTLVFAFTAPVQASDESKEEPIQHYQVPDVTSMEDAERIFVETTAEMKSKKKLDQVELEQIHVVTYSLEKSVAYFAENLKGERQQLAKELAVVVEDIHLASENNRHEAAKAHLSNYFELAERFASGF